MYGSKDGAIAGWNRRAQGDVSGSDINVVSKPDTLNELTKRIADAIDQKFHDMGFEADPRNDPLWHRGVTIELAKAVVAEVKRGEISVIDDVRPGSLSIDIDATMKALNTQYQFCADAIIPRHSDDAPDLRQLGMIRDAHLNIYRILKEVKYLRSQKREASSEDKDNFDPVKSRKDLKPDAWKLLKMPVIQSLLYDINLLPEQITTGKHWFYMLSVLSHMDSALSKHEWQPIQGADCMACRGTGKL